MPQLIGGLFVVGIVLYLYYMLIQWLWVFVAPELVVLGGVLGTAIVPIIYGICVLKVFDPPAGLRGSWRRVFWAPVFVLLFLIYFDLAFLVMTGLHGLVRAASAPVLAELIGLMAFRVPGNRLGAETLTQLFGPLPMFAGFFIGTVVKGVLVAAFLLLARGLENTVVAAQQPAFRQYFFGQAFTDLWRVVGDALKMCQATLVRAGTAIWVVSKGPQAIFLWPLSIAAYLALVAPTIAAGLSLLILLPVHLLGVAVIAAGNLFLAAMLFCMERAVILARSGYAKCPHAGCHQPVPLPIFYCPECGEAHDRLIPGRCGVLFRACSCGKALLPTTFWLGKGKLRSACNHCTQGLSHQLFGGSIHIPIYGAASSGKTMFMMAATWQLVQRQLHGVEADFINAPDRSSYDSAWRPGFESGQVREKTQHLLPDAFLLSARRSSGLPLSLYLYDPAGEAIEGKSEIEGHRFLKYCDGLALLLDPFSLPSFQRLLDDTAAAVPTTSSVNPLEIVNRVVNVLESQANLSRGKHFRRRIAVLITKADIPIVQQEFKLTPSAAAPSARWRDAGLAEDQRIRSWLKQNEPALLQVLDTRFEELRFFMVSALGHDPALNTAFEPRQVLQPLCWLMSSRATMARPRLARFAGRAAEVAAALLVLGAFLVPLGLGVRAALGAVLGETPSRVASETKPAPVSEPAPSPGRRPAPVVVAELTPLPLGLQTMQGFSSSSRKGVRAFRKAQSAYRKRNWAAIEAACREALAHDPAHLEAHRLLAAALHQQHRAPTEVAAHLSAVLAGDFIRYAPGLTTEPDLKELFSTPHGEQVVQLAARYRELYAQAVRSGIVFTAAHSSKPKQDGAPPAGDLYAYDSVNTRYLRIGHGHSAFVGWMIAPTGTELVTVETAPVHGKRADLTEPGPGDPVAPLTTARVSRFDVTTVTWDAKSPALPPARAVQVYATSNGTWAVRTWDAAGRWGLTNPRAWLLDFANGKRMPNPKPTEPATDLLVTADEVVFERAPDLPGLSATWTPVSQGEAPGRDGGASANVPTNTAKWGTSSFRLTNPSITVSLPEGRLAERDSFSVSPGGTRAAFLSIAATPCATTPEERRRTVWMTEPPVNGSARVREVATLDEEGAVRWFDDNLLLYEEHGMIRLFDTGAGRLMATLSSNHPLGLRRLPMPPVCKSEPAAAGGDPAAPAPTSPDQPPPSVE